MTHLLDKQKPNKPTKKKEIKIKIEMTVIINYLNYYYYSIYYFMTNNQTKGKHCIQNMYCIRHRRRTHKQIYYF